MEDVMITITVEIGRYKSAKEMVAVLEKNGNRISDHWTHNAFTKIDFAKELQTCKLVVASVQELGFSQNVTYPEIKAAGLSRGWQLCPAEVGPALREQYSDQPEGECLFITMEPIVDSDGYPCLFRVSHGKGGRFICADADLIEDEWGPAVHQFVFLTNE